MSVNLLEGPQYRVEKGNNDVPYQVVPPPQFFHIIRTGFKTRLQCDYTCEKVFYIVSNGSGFLRMRSSMKSLQQGGCKQNLAIGISSMDGPQGCFERTESARVVRYDINGSGGSPGYYALLRNWYVLGEPNAVAGSAHTIRCLCWFALSPSSVISVHI
jgi:hypothetical protein